MAGVRDTDVWREGGEGEGVQGVLRAEEVGGSEEEGGGGEIREEAWCEGGAPPCVSGVSGGGEGEEGGV